VVFCPGLTFLVVFCPVVFCPVVFCPGFVGLTADAAWDMAGDGDVWRAQRSIAGQASQ